MKKRGKTMKNMLLTTTALVMAAGVAAAEVSFSGSAGAGVSSNAADTDTTVWSGIDLNVAASVTTDGGMTISVGEDFGGGSLADWDDDYAIEAQGSDFDTPTLTITSGVTTISLENNAIDDLYDDDQAGDIGISTSIGGMSVGVTLDTAPAGAVTAVDAVTGAGAWSLNTTTGVNVQATPAVAAVAANGGKPAFSYSVSMPLSGFNIAASGTDANDDGDAANTLSASYTVGDMTLKLSTDDNGAAESTNKLAVSTNVGGASVSVSADDADDWDLSVGYTEGSITLNVSTDENSAWETNVSVDLGGGAAFKVSGTDSNDFVAAGVTFSF
jgi:outer membrane protein OmpU